MSGKEDGNIVLLSLPEIRYEFIQRKGERKKKMTSIDAIKTKNDN